MGHLMKNQGQGGYLGPDERAGAMTGALSDVSL